MKQTLIFRSRSVPSNTATDFSSVLCPMDFGGNELFSKIIWLPQGTFSNMIATINAAPGTGGSGKSWGLTFRRSAASFGAMADQALTVTILETATTARDTTHSFTTPAGGCFLALKWVPTNTPAALSSSGVEISVEFDSANAGESGHSYHPYLLSTPFGKRNGLFSNTGTSWTTAAGAAVASVAAVAGTINGLGLFLPEGAQGGTDHITVVAYKNGVKQDGTGGTVNSTTDLGPADSRKVQTFSLPVSPGDYFWLETTVMSTFGVHIAVGVMFTATTDGQSNFCGQSGNLNTGINPAFLDMEGGGRTWTNTELAATGAANHGGVTTFALSGLQALLENAPGAAKTWTFTQRKSGADAAPTCAITGTATPPVGSDLTHSSTIADGDTFDLKAVPTSNPAVGNMSWAMIQTDSVTSVITPINLAVFDTSTIVTAVQVAFATADRFTRSDAVAVAEFVAKKLPAYKRVTASEVVSVVENIRARFGTVRRVSDAITVTENVKAQKGLKVSDHINVSDAVTVLFRTTRLSESIRVLDNVTVALRIGVLRRLVSEGITVTEFRRRAATSTKLRLSLGDNISVREQRLIGNAPVLWNGSGSAPGDASIAADYWLVGI